MTGPAHTTEATAAEATAADIAFPLGPEFAGRRYALLGVARSGLAAIIALMRAGATVIAWDDNEGARDEAIRHGATVGPLAPELGTVDALILSPGVPLNRHPLAAAARAAGVPIIGDIELFARARPHLPPHKVVGITGTNGKSTTTALIHHIARTAGVPTLMGGNIGLPILAQQPLPAGGIYVLELSSYQIDLTHSLDCDVAVLLNVTPDHLDRYDGSFAAYRDAKLRLFRMQSSGNVGVVASDEAELTDLVLGLGEGPCEWTRRVAGVAVDYDGQAQWPSLQGPHNAQNVWAAMAVADALGIARDVAVRALASFTGLPHRMEHIATVNGVQFINDSKATNPEAAAPALAAYRNIHWIVGGLAKSESLGDCAQYYGNVARAYLIGTAAANFARAIGNAAPTEFCGDLSTAMASAAARARAGDVVLLSPAAASFDQFRDFEARGDAFRAGVATLANAAVTASIGNAVSGEPAT